MTRRAMPKIVNAIAMPKLGTIADTTVIHRELYNDTPGLVSV